MKLFKLNHMTKGWFIGKFTPSVFDTDIAEVAVKKYSAGDYESMHHHKIATEITVITEGFVKMGGVEYGVGDIVLVEPGEAIDFYAVTDAILTVVKIPGVKNDKYMGQPSNA